MIYLLIIFDYVFSQYYFEFEYMTDEIEEFSLFFNGRILVPKSWRAQKWQGGVATA